MKDSSGDQTVVMGNQSISVNGGDYVNGNKVLIIKYKPSVQS